MNLIPKSRGLLLAFMGIPGGGKSSTARAIAPLLSDAVVYHEPEEENWPQAVTRRHEVGYFTAISWFRAARVPQLFAADADRAHGKIAVVDSYYDKLICHYLGHPLMRWLMPPDDRYYPVVQQMAEVDRYVLPNADCVIFLRIAYDDWRHLLSCRNRTLDNDPEFLKSFDTQDVFLKSAQQFATEASAEVVVVDQRIGSAHKTAERAVAELRSRNVLNGSSQQR